MDECLGHISAHHFNAVALASALKKLSVNNLSNITAHPSLLAPTGTMTALPLRNSPCIPSAWDINPELQGAYNKATGDYGLALGSYNMASASHSITIGTQRYTQPEFIQWPLGAVPTPMAMMALWLLATTPIPRLPMPTATISSRCDLAEVPVPIGCKTIAAQAVLRIAYGVLSRLFGRGVYDITRERLVKL